MAFSQATITELLISQSGNEVLVSWSSSSPDGTLFQVYLGQRLAWTGTARQARLPWPSGLGRNAPVDVGTVGTADRYTDYSGSLSSSADRVTLAWLGGTYLADDIAGFYVYSSLVAGGAVNYATPIATVPAYVAGQILDGFGMGGFGEGGFGRAASSYSLTVGPYSGGVWNFAVKAYDAAGNLATPVTASATVSTPPRPPAANSRGVRLTYTYSNSTHKATLAWLASPS